AGRSAVTDRGKVSAAGTPGELKASVGAGAVHVRIRDAAQRPEAARVLSTVLGGDVEQPSDPVALTARVAGEKSERGAAEAASEALAALAAAGVVVDEFSLGQPSLDEAFLALTGERLDTVGKQEQEDAA